MSLRQSVKITAWPLLQHCLAYAYDPSAQFYALIRLCSLFGHDHQREHKYRDDIDTVIYGGEHVGSETSNVGAVKVAENQAGI